ncbi:MAG TPA: 4,5-DOPA dioxygenase extradiol [Polyangiaceae bacterium]|nr:4,5-DOPA dioxygenase extradiol [Polyangiaceae bacterium]
MTDTTPTTPMPVLFIGHGSPMNAIEDNDWSRGFKRIAALLPKPRAVLSISAHWFVPGTFTTGNERPETIHDFGGFPRPLFEMQYPAPGDPALARRVASLLAAANATVRTDWGLDHGTWTVLEYLFPDASCPVVQLSIDHRAPPAAHLELGRALAPLRHEGVLIMGSGNMTHNLRYAMTSLHAGDLSLPSWAESFDRDVAHALEQHDGPALARLVETDAGRRSHPTPDHYFPVLYVAGAASASDTLRFPVEGFDLGSLSMRSAIYG